MLRQVQGARVPAHGRAVGQVPEALLHSAQHGSVETARAPRPARPSVAQGRPLFQWIAYLTTSKVGTKTNHTQTHQGLRRHGPLTWSSQ